MFVTITNTTIDYKDHLNLLQSTTSSTRLICNSTEIFYQSLHTETNFWISNNMALYIIDRSKAYVFPLILLTIAAYGMSRSRMLNILVADSLVKLPSLP